MLDVVKAVRLRKGPELAKAFSKAARHAKNAGKARKTMRMGEKGIEVAG
jgi:hypothetical protein